MAEVTGLISSVAVRLKLDTAELENKANSTMVEFKRMGKELDSIVGNLTAVGVAGSAMFAGLLTFMPGASKELSMFNIDLINLGKSLDDNVTPKIRFLREVFSGLASFIEEHPWIQELISWFLILAPLMAGVGIVVKVLELAFAGLTAIVGALASPWVIITGLVLLAIGLFYEAYVTATELWGQLADLRKLLGDGGWTGNLLVDFFLWLYDAVTWVVGGLEDLYDWLVDIKDMWDSMPQQLINTGFQVAGAAAGAVATAGQVANDIKVDIQTGNIYGMENIEALGDEIVKRLADYYSVAGGTQR